MDAVASSSRTRLHAAYIGGHYGKSLFWYTTELLFGFFLAEVYGLSPAAIGTLLFVFLVWDAITDPVIGALVARRWGQTQDLLVLQAIGAGVSAVAFLGVFVMPDMSSGWLFAYAAIVGLLFRTAYTLYDVPQNTLLARLGDGDSGRLTLSSLRTAFSAIAALTLSAATFFVLDDPHGDKGPLPFLIMAGVFVVIATGSSFLLWRVGRSVAASGPPAVPVQSFALVAHILRVPGILRCLAAIFVLSIGWPLFGKLVPFFAAYVLQNAQLASFMIAAIAIGAAISQPLWIVIGRRMSRSALLTAALLCLLASAAAFVLLARDHAAAAIVSTAFLSAAASAMGMIVWTRLADQTASSAGQGGGDILAFGALTFASKVALGVGGLLLGLSLEFVGYEAGAPMRASSQSALVGVMALGVSACALLAWALIIFPLPAGRTPRVARVSSSTAK